MDRHISRPNIEFTDTSYRLRQTRTKAVDLLTNPMVVSAIIIAIALIIAANLHRPQRHRYTVVDDSIVIDHDTGRCKNILDCY